MPIEVMDYDNVEGVLIVQRKDATHEGARVPKNATDAEIKLAFRNYEAGLKEGKLIGEHRITRDFKLLMGIRT